MIPKKSKGPVAGDAQYPWTASRAVGMEQREEFEEMNTENKGQIMWSFDNCYKGLSFLLCRAAGGLRGDQQKK